VPDPQDTPHHASQPQTGTSLSLLARARANESDAWRALVQLYTPLVCHWCARSGIRGADADDVAQDVFRAVAANLDNFRRDREGDTFRGWLRVITRNAILLHFRRGDRQPQASGGTDALLRMREVADTTAYVPDDAEEETEVDDLRWRALELLRTEFQERTWQMFWLTFVDERSPVDVAADMGVTPAAVRKAKSRVLHRLKEEFTELIQ
jgi:RNA polymerase sigma-70 factor (ECF subfamily)